MQHIVTWWEGELRRSRVYATEESAEVRKSQLKTQSAALSRVSLEPVRVMPQVVFDKMQQLAKVHDDVITCKHGCLRRLCTPCLARIV